MRVVEYFLCPLRRELLDALLRQHAHVDLQSEQREYRQREHRKYDHITKVFHRFDHGANNGLQTYVEKKEIVVNCSKWHQPQMMSSHVNNVRKVPGMMATVLRARSTRNVRKAARFPKSIPMVI